MKRMPAFCALVIVLGSLDALAEGLGLVRGYVGNPDAAGNVFFTLTFNQAPQFYTIDEFGRPEHSFQFYLATDTNLPVTYPDRPYACLIRGTEMPVAHDIRVRNDGPWDMTDPNSDGWGTLRGSVPYRLEGETLTFSISDGVLNIEGPFAYSLLLTEYGAGTPLSPYPGVSGGPINVPEPSVGLIGLAALVVLAGWKRMRRLGSAHRARP